MKISNAFFPTLKEIPTEAQIKSHKLMLRAGLIRMLSSGIYSFLPIGYRVLKKVCQIVREEMDTIGGQEFHLPALNPIEIWEETNRVEAFGDTMFHVKNRNYILAPTHEEIICNIAKNNLKSYKELPQIWYQIQTKFRNEPRPRSGVLRGREFTMKDSYSLDCILEGLNKSYDLHSEAYKKIFSRCGLKFFIVGASSGAMGGNNSQEFLVESKEGGEDFAVVCENCNYASNIEIATSNPQKIEREKISKTIEEIFTPNIKTINQLSEFLKTDKSHLAKSVVYKVDEKPVLILMMGNDKLNEEKLKKYLHGEIEKIEDEKLVEIFGADGGSLGPVNLKNVKIIADKRLENLNQLVCGANKNDFHIVNIDLIRDTSIEFYADIRTVEENEPCVNCSSPLKIITAIELGHIFKLGTKYATSMNATVLNEEGKQVPIIMGSYGIGIERIIACFIEQHSDEDGIIWEKKLSPFDVHLISVNTDNQNIMNTAENIYNELKENQVDVIYDNRLNITAGVKFKDADLLGVPIQLIVSERNVKNGNIEIKFRNSGERSILKIEDIKTFILDFIHK